MNCAHVDGIDIGSRFTVDLDCDEVFVQEAHDLRIVEGLLLHHVAPMAGRIADADEHRPIELARRREGLVAPGIPVDWIVRVLL